MLSPLLWSNIPFGDIEAWYAFLGNHADAHTQLWYAIGQAGLPNYAAHNLADGGGQDWLQVHHGEHRDAARALSLSAPPDLASYDLTDPEQFAVWMEANADDHVRLHQAIGLF